MTDPRPDQTLRGCEHQWGYRGVQMPEGYVKPTSARVCLKCGLWADEQPTMTLTTTADQTPPVECCVCGASIPGDTKWEDPAMVSCCDIVADLRSLLSARDAEVSRLTAQISEQEQAHRKECDELRPGRWRTFKRDCPRTFPNVPMADHLCSCVDCVEIRNEREVHFQRQQIAELRASLAEREQEIARLKPYALHRLDCASRYDALGRPTRHYDQCPCNCGLDQLLSSSSTPTQEP